MLVEIDIESLERAFSVNLKNSIDNIKQTLAENDESKEGSGTFSWDYDEDCKRLFELLEGMKVTLDWYKEYA